MVEEAPRPSSPSPSPFTIIIHRPVNLVVAVKGGPWFGSAQTQGSSDGARVYLVGEPSGFISTPLALWPIRSYGQCLLAFPMTH